MVNNWSAGKRLRFLVGGNEGQKTVAVPECIFPETKILKQVLL